MKLPNFRPNFFLTGLLIALCSPVLTQAQQPKLNLSESLPPILIEGRPDLNTQPTAVNKNKTSQIMPLRQGELVGETEVPLVETSKFIFNPDTQTVGVEIETSLGWKHSFVLDPLVYDNGPNGSKQIVLSSEVFEKEVAHYTGGKEGKENFKTYRNVCFDTNQKDSEFTGAVRIYLDDKVNCKEKVSSEKK